MVNQNEYVLVKKEVYDEIVKLINLYINADDEILDFRFFIDDLISLYGEESDQFYSSLSEFNKLDDNLSNLNFFIISTLAHFYLKGEF